MKCSRCKVNTAKPGFKWCEACQEKERQVYKTRQSYLQARAIAAEREQRKIAREL